MRSEKKEDDPSGAIIRKRRLSESAFLKEYDRATHICSLNNYLKKKESGMKQQLEIRRVPRVPLHLRTKVSKPNLHTVEAAEFNSSAGDGS